MSIGFLLVIRSVLVVYMVANYLDIVAATPKNDSMLIIFESTTLNQGILYPKLQLNGLIGIFDCKILQFNIAHGSIIPNAKKYCAICSWVIGMNIVYILDCNIFLVNCQVIISESGIITHILVTNVTIKLFKTLE